MKKLLSLLVLASLSFGFSSCCSMFGISDSHPTEIRKVKKVTYTTVQEQTYIAPDAKTGIGGMTEVSERSVPSYSYVDKKVRVSCPKGTRFYCAKKGCGGTTSENAMKMATAQGPVGSPHIGLVPTMKKLAE